MAETTSKAAATEEIIPIILDAGSRSKKSIDKFKNGEGKLMDEVAEIIKESRASGKETGPIVIIYKEKTSKSLSSIIKIPLSPLGVFDK